MSVALPRPGRGGRNDGLVVCRLQHLHTPLFPFGFLGGFAFLLLLGNDLRDDSLDDRHPLFLRHSGKMLQTVLQLYGSDVRHQFIQYLRAVVGGFILRMHLVHQSDGFGICLLRFGIARLLPVQVS